MFIKNITKQLFRNKLTHGSFKVEVINDHLSKVYFLCNYKIINNSTPCFILYQLTTLQYTVFITDLVQILYRRPLYEGE